jgi:MraZ protein
MGDEPTFVVYSPTVNPGNAPQKREVTDVTGQYAHNIDAKGRLFIPAKLREELGATFHVTVGQDHCLSVYSDESWNLRMEKLKEMSYSQVKELRPMFANAADCEPDAQGRILIPSQLRRYAGLEKEVVVIGSFDRVEIWNAQRWAEMESQAFSSGALEAAMEAMGL